MTTITIREEPLTALAEHAQLSIAFTVDRVLDVEPLDAGLGGFTFIERAVPPWVKDYDRSEAPTAWPQRFDVSAWGLLAAYIGDERVGGATIAYGAPDVQMLDGRTDLAVLWDLRVHPTHRGNGVGRALFAAVERWATERGCRELKIETQSINVAACRFYARMGSTLGAIDRFAYATAGYPDETQLIWRKPLPQR
jgi:GNAT superfamily N-acetyltransferase